MNMANVNVFPNPSDPNFIKLSPTATRALLWAHHWGAPLEYTNKSRKILKVHPGGLPREMGGKLCVFKSYQPLNEFVDQPKNRRGTLIVGSPGIGKTTFLPYKFVQRLSRRLETLYYSGPTLYFFNEHGAFEVLSRQEYFFDDKRWDDIMALVDAEAGHNPPLLMLWSGNSQVRLVFATYPQVERYKEWRKQRSIATFIPNPPEFEEAILVYIFASQTTVLTHGQTGGSCTRSLIQLELIRTSDTY
ncbi:hypothetical protein GYMLUDRAFT_818017 [Collybiopsis luxurians FD-317 M1]|uniref:Uncharacterized protein n=1 Tax=Collybiopsis luxurians FD-317 M1 TaxID=944289 RepID=A0A0D0CMD2_9AGAR|nr:hypothetical protein GYMLUDRAFT_818017 [Collybiopsis luxurians FD-317 M1]